MKTTKGSVSVSPKAEIKAWKTAFWLCQFQKAQGSAITARHLISLSFSSEIHFKCSEESREMTGRESKSRLAWKLDNSTVSASITDPKEPQMLTKKMIKMASFLSKYAIFMQPQLARMTELWLFISFQCKMKGKRGKFPQFTPILDSFCVAHISCLHLLSLIWSFRRAARAGTFSTRTLGVSPKPDSQFHQELETTESLLWSVEMREKSLPTLFFSFFSCSFNISRFCFRLHLSSSQGHSRPRH